jgi:hypothetical protein
MKRYDVMSPRERKDGKTYWQRVGTAFEGDKGIGIEFDALPLPDKEGRVSVRLFEPRERDGAPRQQTQQRQSADLDDSVPW